MPMPFGAIGQKCSPILSTTSQLSAQLLHDREDQQSFQLSSSFLSEEKEGQDPARAHFGYHWSDDSMKWSYSLGLGAGVISNKLDYAFTRSIRGDLTLSHSNDQLSGARMHLIARERNFCVQAFYDLISQKPIAEIVVGNKGCVAGVQLNQRLDPTTFSYVFGYNRKGSDWTISFGEKLSSWTFSEYHKINEKLEVGLRYKKSRVQKAEVGVRYTVDADTAVKMKLCNTTKKKVTLPDDVILGFNVMKQVSKGVKVGAGLVLDPRGAAEPKFGCVVSFDG